MIKNKKIFITGGAGFIGTALCSRLIDKNEIVIYDSLRRNSIKDTDLLSRGNLTLVKGDVLDKKRLEKAIENSDIVIHLAAIAGVDTVLKNPLDTLKINLIGTYNVLESARKHCDLERFVNFSTSEVYGPYAYKLNENSNITIGTVGEARWIYANSKLTAEHFTFSYYKQFNLPVVSIRPFNVYGPGQVGEGAVHVFVVNALKNNDIQIHGDGNQIRAWCYISDIVDATLLCIEKKEAIGDVFNIGNPRSTITILNLAQKIIQLSNSKSKIVFVPKNYVDVELRVPDIEKSRRKLGFEPKVDLEEGLKRTIEWYKNKLGI